MRNSLGQFIKGSSGFNKKHTEETKSKISLSKKGQRPWLGRKHSEETKLKISQVQLGKSRKHAKQFKKGFSPWNKGKGTKCKEQQLIRASLEYRLWRKSVFERDNYTCIWCGIRGGELQADHIKPFALFPELRLAIDNGRTLCRSCHLTTDTWGKNKPK
jgi:hypothetical protein